MFKRLIILFLFIPCLKSNAQIILGKYGAAPTVIVCTAVSIVESPLPDGLQGDLYYKELPLTGTAPFSLGSVTKPLWLSITILGSKIIYTGTPGMSDVGTGISISVTVTNCTSGTDSYTDAINVQSIVAPVTPRVNLLHETTFEGASYGGATIPVNIGSAWSNTQHCCGYSVSAAPLARTGTGAVKFLLKRGDPLVSSSSRSEMQSNGAGVSEGGPNTERWFAASFYRTAANEGMDMSVIQWHQSQANGIPPLALWISGNRWMLVNTNTGCPGAAPGCSPAGNEYVDIAPVQIGVWTDVVFHIKWSNTATGIIQVWVNGVLRVNLTNNITGYNDGYYMKVGIYKWTWEGLSVNGDEEILYVDDVRVGNQNATYYDVAPGNY